MISSESEDDPNLAGITPAATVIDCTVFNIKRICSLAFLLKAKPAFFPLQFTVQTGTARSGTEFNSDRLHSRARRTSPHCISLTSWWVGIESSRRRRGIVERRSCWMQNQTWPLRLPKMVLITIVFEGRGGATVIMGLSVDCGELDSWSSSI